MAGSLRRIQPAGENPEVDYQKQHSELQVKSVNESSKTYQFITLLFLHSNNYQRNQPTKMENSRLLTGCPNKNRPTMVFHHHFQ